MKWQLTLALIVGSMLVIMLTGLPIAFVFILACFIWAVVIFGGEAGVRLYVLGMQESVSSFTLVPIALFVLMGEVLFLSGVATLVINTLDMWLGRVPGRLSLLAVVAGVVFAVVSGSTVASSALLATVLLPEMRRRGYSKSMSLGPIMGAGTLSPIIPPSAMAVLLASVAGVSVAKVLIGGLIPGLVMAFIFAAYIVIRSWLQPSEAPPYEVPPTPLSEKLVATAKNVLPLGLIVFMVLGLIFLGIATPSEASALGALSAIVLAACYRKLSWEVMKKSLLGSARVMVMILMIIASAKVYGQILAFSGATQGMLAALKIWDMPP